jgi:hypothetical protein
MRSRPPIRTGKLPEERRECEDLYHGLGTVRGAAEKEIEAARQSSGGSSGVAALCTRERKEKWCGVKRRFGLAFYRAEGEVERTAEAVAATVAAVSGRGRGGGR